MYVDENVQRYQHYEYKIIAKWLSGENIMESIESNPVGIQAQ
jgi:hypothetical protein